MMERNTIISDSQVSKEARLFLDRKDFLNFYKRIDSYLEVGVYAGDYTDLVIDILAPSHATLVDFFGTNDFEQLGEIKESRFTEDNHLQYITERYSGIDLRAISGNSHWVLKDLIKEGKTFDYIYIDADHSFPGAYGDLLLASSLISEGGCIGMNDFTMAFWDMGKPCGVIDAVAYFLHNNKDWEIFAYAMNHRNNYHGDVYLRRSAESS